MRYPNDIAAGLWERIASAPADRDCSDWIAETIADARADAVEEAIEELQRLASQHLRRPEKETPCPA